jgi:hypothetical protein
MTKFFAAILFLTGLAYGDVTSFSVKPSFTDPAIQTFDEPHWVYVDREIVVDHKEGMPQDRKQLLLWITGTGGMGHGASAFCTLGANLGYHVVSLMYPDSLAATTCRSDPNPHAFENFRMALIQGGPAYIQGGREYVTVARAESIENRLIKLLMSLQQLRPRENWGQFLNEDGSIKWESIAVAGQSQGGGHAALIGVKHLVARVLCFGAPKDYNVRLNAPALWYTEESATPKDRFFAFNHHQDPMGCTPDQLLRNLETLGLGEPEEVDDADPPFRNSHDLYTSWPQVTVTGEGSDGARMAHTSQIANVNAARWTPVWTYMLTALAP